MYLDWSNHQHYRKNEILVLNFEKNTIKDGRFEKKYLQIFNGPTQYLAPFLGTKMVAKIRSGPKH